jgi:hypothetical protein
MTLKASIIEGVRNSVRYVLRRSVKNDPEALLDDAFSPGLSDESLGGNSRSPKIYNSTGDQERTRNEYSRPLMRFCDVPDELLKLKWKLSRRRQSSKTSTYFSIIVTP